MRNQKNLRSLRVAKNWKKNTPVRTRDEAIERRQLMIDPCPDETDAEDKGRQHRAQRLVEIGAVLFRNRAQDTLGQCGLQRRIQRIHVAIDRIGGVPQFHHPLRATIRRNDTMGALKGRFQVIFLTIPTTN